MKERGEGNLAVLIAAPSIDLAVLGEREAVPAAYSHLQDADPCQTAHPPGLPLGPPAPRPLPSPAPSAASRCLPNKRSGQSASIVSGYVSS